MDKILNVTGESVDLDLTQNFIFNIEPDSPEEALSLALWELALAKSDPFIHLGEIFHDWAASRLLIQALYKKGFTETEIIELALKMSEVVAWH